jgi:hypothetical protein
MKYVAYLDILGFRNRLKILEQRSAELFIADFSSTIYNLWKSDTKYEQNLKGYIVSDSLIINTKDTSLIALNVLLDIIVAICRDEFSKNSVLIRGAIAKGEFDKLEAKELGTLEKGLIVGQAYVDAYLLEGSVKTLGIVLSNETYEDIQRLIISHQYIFAEEIVTGEKHFFLRYLSIEYLMSNMNIKKFVNLAIESKWLPHYYNALYFSLQNENSYKANQVFHSIISIINGNEQSEHWRELDMFIQNSFADGVMSGYQKRFLGFLRNNLQ